MKEVTIHFVPPFQGVEEIVELLPRPLAWAKIGLRLRREKTIIKKVEQILMAVGRGKHERNPCTA